MLLAATLLVSAHATAPSPEPFTVTEVAPGVFAAVASTAEDSPHGNGGFVVGSEAVLVVDSFATAEAAERLIAEVRARTSLPIRFAVLTHFHSDHTGGSAAYAKAGAAVLAHENVRAWVRREWQTDLASEQKSRYAALRLPDVTFRDRVSIDLGGRMRIVDAVHQPGHSGSDSLVLVPDAKVVFTGDLFSKRCIPGTTFARTDAWIATLDDLLRAYPDWTFVPGHGETGKALDVRSFRDYLTGLRQAVARALYDGKSGAALLEAVKAQMAVRYKSWAGFEEIDRNIADTERELTGTKAYPPAPPG
jgi:glyoxylase-like metal-dependent hydrolase (beta-lactamase superfamily II)